MKKSIKAMVLGVIASATIVSGGITSPANAVPPLTVDVSKKTDLSTDGESVSISVSGIPTGQGIYVYQCATNVADPRPASDVCRTGMSESLWLSTSPGQIVRGAGDANLAQTFNLLRTFTISSVAYDCRVTSCGVFVRRDHLGSADFSLDTLVPITFQAQLDPTLSETAAPKPRLSDKVVSKIKFATGEKSLSKATKKKLKADLPSYVLASKIVITGTAGSTMGASELVVKKLAKKRAMAIKKYLVSQGVAAGKIVIKVKVAKAGTKPSTKIVANP